MNELNEMSLIWPISLYTGLALLFCVNVHIAYLSSAVGVSGRKLKIANLEKSTATGNFAKA